jgi:D-alanyl-D-alanine carboxypeptidase/D-alanyl-D-alanine-endopeptidase (penicillin-binding protein 4)
VQHTLARLIDHSHPFVFTASIFFTVLTAIGCASRLPTAFPDTSITAALDASALGQTKRFLDNTLHAPPLETTLWGIDVRSIDRDEQIYTNNPDMLLTPASTQKVITLAVASQALGWDDRFETTLFTNGHIERNVLHGDLIVKGSGDPTIDTDVLSSWVDKLRMQGIHRVTGNIIGDDRITVGQDLQRRGTPSPPPLGFGWSWDDLAFGFAAPVGPLQYRENVVAIQVTPSRTVNAPAELTIQTAGSGLNFINQVSTASGTEPSLIQLRRVANTPNLVVSGSISLGSRAIVRSVSVANPTSFFVQAFHAALEANGVVVLGDAVDIDQLSETHRHSATNELYALLTIQSEPLSTIAIDMMKRSQNLFAESIYRRLGFSFNDSSSAIVAQVLADWGIQRNRAIVVDGSGLSRYNYLTASALTDILVRLYQNEVDQTRFLPTLPIANEDGTLRNRFGGTASAGNALAKTGSMSHVRALAGYVTTADGEQLAFSILANNYSADPTDVVTAIDAFVSALATMSRGDS